MAYAVYNYFFKPVLFGYGFWKLSRQYPANECSWIPITEVV